MKRSQLYFLFCDLPFRVSRNRKSFFFSFLVCGTKERTFTKVVQFDCAIVVLRRPFLNSRIHLLAIQGSERKFACGILAVLAVENIAGFTLKSAP